MYVDCNILLVREVLLLGWSFLKAALLSEHLLYRVKFLFDRLLDPCFEHDELSFASP